MLGLKGECDGRTYKADISVIEVSSVGQLAIAYVNIWVSCRCLIDYDSERVATTWQV